MLKNYIKMAFKVMMRRKFFTAISLFGISFTLAVLMIVTAIIDQQVGANPPETHRDRILYLNLVRFYAEDGSFSRISSPSYYFLDKYVRSLQTPEKVAIYGMNQFTSFINGQKKTFDSRYTDEQFWDIFNYHFLEGGPFLKADIEKANRVAVINEKTKKEYFGEEKALGKSITFNGTTFRIVGVVETTSQAMRNSYADVWLPLTLDPRPFKKADIMGHHAALILARSQEDMEKIKRELANVSQKIESPDAERPVIKALAYSSLENFGKSPSKEDAKTAQTFAIIITLMILFMVLPTINLVNINISRIMERSSEIGVRKAFGANSFSLVGQFIIENLILTMVAGFIGLAIAVLFISLMGGGSLTISWRVFAVGLLLSSFFGVFSGVYPAWRMSRLHTVNALKGGVK